MAHAKKSAIHIGLFAFPVRLEVAVDKEASTTHTVCTGDGTTEHAPARVKNRVECPECQTTHSSVYGFAHRGVERDGKLVVLTAEEIKATAGTPIKELKLGWHSREKVYAATVAGDSVQYVVPDKGGENGYAVVVAYLTAHPDVVAASTFAPSTKNAMWLLEVADGRLLLSKRPWPEDVRVRPAITPGAFTDAEYNMLSSYIDSEITDFDPLTYRDMSREAMEKLVTERSGDAVPVTPMGAPVASSGDMLSALQASLEANQPKPKPVRRAAAKRAPAKRAPAKKAAAKKVVAA